MPAWITHVVTANKILDKIDIKDKNSFIFGNVLPDINNAHFVKDVKNKLTHTITHFTRKEDLSETKYNYYNIERFEKEYKESLNNPVVLGYLVHIITDSYWNEIAFNEHYIYNESKEFIALRLYDKTIVDCDKHTATSAKQKDFNVFSNYLLNKNKNVKMPCYTEELAEESNIIKENPITGNDIKKAIKCLDNMVLNSQIDEEYKYQLFTCEELEEKFERSISVILEKIDSYISKI